MPLFNYFQLISVLVVIARSYIESNLRKLDRMYISAKTPKESLYYAKLAILELCGWIEESMDDVILGCARRHLRVSANRSHLENDVVKNNYGFEYKKHFRNMLIQLIGLVNVEKMERSIDPLKFDRLKSTLGSLKGARNPEAHTHIKNATRRINAPSVTLAQFPAIYDGLKEIDNYLRASKY